MNISLVATPIFFQVGTVRWQLSVYALVWAPYVLFSLSEPQTRTVSCLAYRLQLTWPTRPGLPHVNLDWSFPSTYPRSQHNRIPPTRCHRLTYATKICLTDSDQYDICRCMYHAVYLEWPRSLIQICSTATRKIMSFRCVFLLILNWLRSRKHDL